MCCVMLLPKFHPSVTTANRAWIQRACAKGNGSANVNSKKMRKQVTFNARNRNTLKRKGEVVPSARIQSVVPHRQTPVVYERFES
eukprot:scaffold55327_cov48-Attheya_sp.AAC.1